MFRWIAICILAFAVTKWSGKVHADDELDEEEKLLLQAFEDVIGEDDKREYDICEEECAHDPDIEQCILDCEEDDMFEKRMELAARKQEAINKELYDHQKKLSRIQSVRRRFRRRLRRRSTW